LLPDFHSASDHNPKVRPQTSRAKQRAQEAPEGNLEHGPDGALCYGDQAQESRQSCIEPVAKPETGGRKYEGPHNKPLLYQDYNNLLQGFREMALHHEAEARAGRRRSQEVRNAQKHL